MSEPGLGHTRRSVQYPLPKGYRFRTNWRGKLVLQRLEHAPYIDGPLVNTSWRDATAEDLVHFFTTQES